MKSRSLVAVKRGNWPLQAYGVCVCIRVRVRVYIRADAHISARCDQSVGAIT